MKYFILIFFLFVTSIVFAQNVNFGVELGANLNPMEENEMGQDFRIGAYSGLNSQIQIKNNFHFTTGLAISQKSKYRERESITSLTDDLENFIRLLSGFGGGGFNINIDSITDALGVNTDIIKVKKIHSTITHLQVPLLATYQYKKVQLHLGGYGSFMLSANNRITEEQNVPFLQALDITQFDSTGIASFLLPKKEDVKTYQNNDKSYFGSFDAGAIVGLSYFVDRLNFGIYYSYGLIDYRFIPDVNNKENYKSLRFSLSYLINIKKDNNKIILE